jgi:carbon storage regulator
MLVLTRRAGESVRIGDDVTVTVLDVRGEVVRVGIQAPRSVAVHRDEIYRALRHANQQAAASATRATTGSAVEDDPVARLSSALREAGRDGS